MSLVRVGDMALTDEAPGSRLYCHARCCSVFSISVASDLTQPQCGAGYEQDLRKVLPLLRVAGTATSLHPCLDRLGKRAGTGHVFDVHGRAFIAVLVPRLQCILCLLSSVRDRVGGQ